MTANTLGFRITNPPPRVKIMDPESGGVIVINQPGLDEPMVTIHPDGTLAIGEGYTPDAAATEFWQAMASSFPRYFGEAACSPHNLCRCLCHPV